MNTVRFTVAAALASAAALAVAFGQPAFADTTVPIDGGGASGLTLGEPAATGSPRSRAEVAAQARDTSHQLNSRSGEQTDAEDTLHVQVASSRSRDDVRREGMAFSRQAHEIFEGGQSGAMLGQARQPAPVVLARMAASAD